jgi:hypothetical protein
LSPMSRFVTALNQTLTKLNPDCRAPDITMAAGL